MNGGHVAIWKAVKPRFWLIVMAIFALSMGWNYTIQAGYMNKQLDAIEELEQQRAALIKQNAMLQRKIAFAYTDEFVIREAREKLGLLREKEILFECNMP